MQSDSAEQQGRRDEDETYSNGDDDNDSQQGSISDMQSESDDTRAVQDAINQQHPFGIKIWKPALYRRGHQGSDRSDEAVHSDPGKFTSRTLHLSFGNIAWMLLFGWWLSILYLLLAFVVLWPFVLVGRAVRPIDRGYLSEPLQELSEYIDTLGDISHYIRWPFGKFVTKKEVNAGFHLDHNQNRRRYREDEEHLLAGIYEPPKLTRYVFKSALTLFLAPAHMLVSGLCFFTVVAIPMGRLNFILLTLLYTDCTSLKINNPFTHTSHLSQPSTATDPTEESIYPTVSIVIMGTATTEIQSEHLTRHSLAPASILLSSELNVDSIALQSSSDSVGEVPEIVIRPYQPEHRNSIQAAPQHEKKDEIVLCIHHAIGFQYYRYQVRGVNIIFINLLSANVFCFIDYYILAPRNGFTGISSPIIIFTSGLLSVIPLAYLIGMSVSSITTHTGSLALGAVINATFGSIVEVLIYGFALSQGKIRMVEGSIVGSFLCGLLALPGISMLSDGLKRTESNFNAKSAGITSTLLIVALIVAFTPTIFQKIFGTFDLVCADVGGEAVVNGVVAKGCGYVRSDPAADFVYNSATKYLMYICTAVLLLTYAIGLIFTLMTHAHTIYPSMVNQRPKKDRLSKRLSRFDASLSPQVKPTPSDTLKKRSLLSHVPNRDSATSTYGTNIYLQSHLPNSPSQTSPHPLSKQTPSHADSEESSKPPSPHASPNWSTLHATLTLITCTILFSLIAEILVTTVDHLLAENASLDEKFLGVTLFAIVPSFTEFYNAILFALNGNIALSLELASAYTIQVALLQIPVLVIFSLLYTGGGMTEFTLVFPTWDLFVIAMSVFLLTFVFAEGKSNYFKGSMLLLVYLVLVATFLYLPVREV